ncbi:MAG: DNA starvation/stationary phase protection protein [Bacteroidota bacterium]
MTRPTIAEHPTGSLAKATMGTEPLVAVGENEGNPVGLNDDGARALAHHLDAHLATYGVLYHQYHKHHWLVAGPQFRDLHLHLEGYYNEIHADFDRIAERVTVLGGIPTCSPSEQEKLAYIQHEPEGQYRVRQMLELDILCEKRVCQKLRDSIHLAIAHSDFGTKSLLEVILRRAEDRAHHLEHFLEADTMEIGLTSTADEVTEDPVLEAIG